MHPSHNRSRRKRGKNVKHDDGGGQAHMVSWSDDGQTDSFSRSRPHSHHQTDTYIPSTSRSTYSMSRDGPSSHTDTQDRSHPLSSDFHHRGGRDDHDATESRDGDHWTARSPHDTHYRSSRGWSPRDTRDFDQGHSAAHRGESSGWGTHGSHEDKHHFGRESPDWRRAEQEGDRKSSWDNKEPRNQATRRWQSDNGWESRKHNQPIDPLAKEDRSWEPGPGWQSRGGDQGHRNQRLRNNAQGKNKGKKNNQSRQRQRGERERDRDRGWDRRNEDSLNNWQRREFHPLPPKPTRNPVKRLASTSRSRSRTPDSMSSRRSSRGRSRSRSRSFSPRTERRLYSPHNRTPPNRKLEGNRSKSPTSSHRGHSNRISFRRQSISSLSSYSRSRSRSSSRSPDDRPKAKHRLPPATSIREISLSITKTTLHQRSTFPNNQEPGSAHNGKAPPNGKQHGRPPTSSLREDGRQAVEQMPPPSEIPLSSSVPCIQDLDAAVSPVTARADAGSPNRARIGSTKSAGFKPIGSTSSSVKMFFPRDDEESEEYALASHQEFSVRPGIPAKRTREDEVTDQDAKSCQSTRRTHETPTPLQDDAPRESTLEPKPPPSPVAHDAPKASSSPKPSRNGHVAATPAQPSRVTDLEIDSVTRPSSPTTASRKELYAIVSQVGEGTFGKVYKARNTITSVHVALKRIRMEAERDGFPVTAMREIKLLQSLRHQNIVRLYEMMVSNGSVFMVFEYMDHDLTGILSQTQFSFSEANLKSLCNQMLAGLAYLHHKGVIHRDIKGSNILINNRGELKLADFGLARFYQKRRRSDYTNRVITLWYRPPELLFGATVYGPEVDMWSAGCIMLELFTKKPVFQGNDEIHQLDVIYRVFGTPTPARWSGITGLPWYELVKPNEVIEDRFRELFQKWLSPAALDLAEQLLTYDPTKRVTAVQALEASYFKELPRPELPVGLSSLEGEWHELETKRERAKKRRKLESAMQPQVV